jgi:hypothetical protein
MTPVLVEFLVGLYFVVADSPALFESPEPSAPSSATLSASVKRAEKTVAPSPTPEPSSAQ